jgi:hypothetical protein
MHGRGRYADGTPEAPSFIPIGLLWGQTNVETKKVTMCLPSLWRGLVQHRSGIVKTKTTKTPSAKKMLNINQHSCKRQNPNSLYHSNEGCPSFPALDLYENELFLHTLINLLQLVNRSKSQNILSTNTKNSRKDSTLNSTPQQIQMNLRTPGFPTKLDTLLLPNPFWSGICSQWLVTLWPEITIVVFHFSRIMNIDYNVSFLSTNVFFLIPDQVFFAEFKIFFESHFDVLWIE